MKNKAQERLERVRENGEATYDADLRAEDQAHPGQGQPQDAGQKIKNTLDS